jgi:hypothetical protein
VFSYNGFKKYLTTITGNTTIINKALPLTIIASWLVKIVLSFYMCIVTANNRGYSIALVVILLIISYAAELFMVYSTTFFIRDLGWHVRTGKAQLHLLTRSTTTKVSASEQPLLQQQPHMTKYS